MNRQSKSIVSSILIFLLAFTCAYAQEGFQFISGKKKDKIKFELVNNLVVIPVELNGTKLSFLLDTGVSSTIVFGIAENDSIEIKKATPIKIRGLGAGEAIDGFKSSGNTFRVGDAVDTAHTLYYILDNELNFSPRMGVPIHGILGYDFFKNFVVETSYTKKRIKFYDSNSYQPKICKKCEVFELVFNGKKPFVNISTSFNEEKKELLVLLDSGSSDALWLFEDYGLINEKPKNYFKDFLGLGLSGTIYGKRSKIENIQLGRFEFKEMTVAFPDSVSLEYAKRYEERDGSIGGKLLKRFTTIIDYSRNTFFLKKNSNFSDPFYYNMSGLIIEHNGVEFKFEENRKSVASSIYAKSNSSVRTSPSLTTIKTLDFKLVPRYIVAQVREGSPAALKGIKKGDEILRVNGKQAHLWKLHELNTLFSSEEGKKITIQILDTLGLKQTLKFKLKKVF